VQQLLEFFVPILEFFAMLSFLVIIHELGHFVTARFFKVKIEEFGLGYPPLAKKLFAWKGIPFTLNWIPIGGFVKMEGETGVSENKEKPESKFGPFNSKSKMARLIIILAGATVNFIFGVLAFTFIYSRVGIPTPVTPPQSIVVELSEGPGKEAGLMPEDRIVSARDAAGNEIEAHAVSDFTKWVRSRPDTDISLIISRGDETKELKLHTRPANEIEEKGAISVALAEPIEAKFYPWYRMPFESAKFGLMRSFELTKLILGSLGKMGSDLFQQGKVPTDVAGPIGIVSEVTKQKVFSGGLLRALDFTAMFSINLAIMNILPIPALDGGRAVFIILEFFLGKKRVSKVEDHAHGIGIIALLLIILLISIKDVWVIFRG
jgi:regulator of sigma E protease